MASSSAQSELCVGGAGLADDNAKVQAAAGNMLNLALTLPDAPADLPTLLVSPNTLPCCHSQLGLGRHMQSVV